MDEPPAKRVRHTDSANTRDINGAVNITSPHSPRPFTTDREQDVKNKTQHDDVRNGAHGPTSRRDDDYRRRSRSPRDRDRRDRRSRSPRDRGYRDRERDVYRDRVPRDGRRPYERNKDRSRSRDRDRDRDRERNRSGRDQKPDRRRSSRSPYRNGTSVSNPSSRPRSPPSSTATTRAPIKAEDATPQSRDIKTQPSQSNNVSRSKPADTSMDLDESIDPNDPDMLMKKLMGFSTFKTTQNTKVPGNNIYGVRKEKKTEYRQYMNRVGGFNRPLSPGK